MSARKLGPFEVSPISLGCMSLSYAYGAPPPREDAVQLLNEALDLGYTMLDTAALYGFGANEELLREAVGHRRAEYTLASKCGIFTNAAGVREIDGRPETLKRTCDDSLRRLGVEVIDLYYLHRWDRKVPIEESIGAMAELVAAGKVRTLGLSEVSAQTVRKAHREHPITAVQTEYSLWTRNPEIGVLDTCRELGIAFVAFSPVTRGFLCGYPADPEQLAENDLRRSMPRYSPEHFAKNRHLIPPFREIAAEVGCTPAQLTLAWVLAQGENIIAIPGTANLQHLRENFAAAEVALTADQLERLDRLINQHTVSGPRYNAATQATVDTEEFV